jgi:hypothetical protein
VSAFAGVDIGNATTEIVVAVDGEPVLWDRMPTRGVKGSVASGQGAARLLARMERRLGRRVDLAVMTQQHPVDTSCIDIGLAPTSMGRLVVLSRGPLSPAGAGVGVGRPMRVEQEPRVVDGPVVLVASDPLGFRETVQRVRQWQAAGVEIDAVLLAGDEARLVSTRIEGDLPVVDAIDVDAVMACTRVAVEVAGEGRALAVLSDPLRLGAGLGLDGSEHADSVAAVESLRGSRSAVIGVLDTRPEAPEPNEQEWLQDLRAHADDVWTVDLREVVSLPGWRADAVATTSMVVASLRAASGGNFHVEGLRGRWDGDVVLVSSEVDAGRAGALTTPGVAADAVVLDLGGGTLDMSDGVTRTTLAGCGEMLTVAVSDVLAISRGASEWVKRGPARRIDAPALAIEEDGGRHFLDPFAPPGTVGWLVCRGPGGTLPFARHLGGSEWRMLRLALKKAVVGNNVRRALPHGVASEIVLVGGPAGDDELVEAVGRAVPDAVIGRADVAGQLGHRWAVAWGLVLAATS